jgi:hypothetical protein
MITKSKNLQQLLEEAKVKIPGLTKLGTLNKNNTLNPTQGLTPLVKSKPATRLASQSTTVNVAGDSPVVPDTNGLSVQGVDASQAAAMMKTFTDLQSSNEPISRHFIKQVAQSLMNCKCSFGETFIVPSYYWKGMTPLSKDSSQVQIDPDLLMSQLMLAMGALDPDLGFVTRRSSNSAQLSFDINGDINIGGTLYTSINYVPDASAADGLGIMGYLIQVQAQNKLDGGSSITITPGDAFEDRIPEISMQLGQNNNMGYIFIPMTIVASLLSTTQAISVDGAGNPLIVDDATVSQVATDKFISVGSYSGTGVFANTVLNISGINTIINVFPLFLDDARAAAMIEQITTGGIKFFGNSIVQNAETYFAEQ